MCGSGRPASSPPILGSPPRPTGSTPSRSLAAATGFCAAAHGPPRPAWPAPAFATGTSPSGDRSSPGCASPPEGSVPRRARPLVAPGRRLTAPGRRLTAPGRRLAPPGRAAHSTGPGGSFHRPGRLALPPAGAAARVRGMRIQGSGALVVGGASGLGGATARRLCAEGAEVVIAGLNRERGAELAAELQARFVPADVTDAAQVQAAVQAAAEAGRGLRISVCCAGIGWAERVASRRGAHALEPFETIIRVNLIGTFNVLRLAAAAMLAQEPEPSGERGVCVNTASIAAFDGQIGQVAYSASKGAIVGMTLPAARDLAVAGVRVCTIAPGTFDTPLL